MEKLYERLARLVEETSKEINITAIRDYEDILNKHIFDSLMPQKLMPEVFVDGSSILDLGTGGGFPGLPLAIAFPNCKFVLMDSTRKKLDVVDQFTKELNLQNVETLWARAEIEDLTEKKKVANKKNALGQYDIVVARSVSYLPKLLETVKPLLKPNGIFIAYKMFNEDEIKEGDLKADQIHMKKVGEHKYILPKNQQERVLLVYGLLGWRRITKSTSW